MFIYALGKVLEKQLQLRINHWLDATYTLHESRLSLGVYNWRVVGAMQWEYDLQCAKLVGIRALQLCLILPSSHYPGLGLLLFG
jgi:hypothetical protein